MVLHKHCFQRRHLNSQTERQLCMLLLCCGVSDTLFLGLLPLCCTINVCHGLLPTRWSCQRRLASKASFFHLPIVRSRKISIHVAKESGFHTWYIWTALVALASQGKVSSHSQNSSCPQIPSLCPLIPPWQRRSYSTPTLCHIHARRPGGKNVAGGQSDLATDPCPGGSGKC